MRNSFSRIRHKYALAGYFLIVCSVWMQHSYFIDYSFQQFFYSKDHGWMIYDSDPVVKFIFYTSIKIILAMMSLLLVYFYAKDHGHSGLKRIFAFLFCMIFIPFIISRLKAWTNIHCPNDLFDFGGKVPYRSLFDFDTYSPILNQYGDGNCFPAGHASGGYAFMSNFLVLPEKHKIKGIIVGFLIGTYMAIFQMMKGAHFLSHTLFTLGFSIIVIHAVQILVSNQNSSSEE